MKKCTFGEINNPVLRPAKLQQVASLTDTLPYQYKISKKEKDISTFPLVPATCTIGIFPNGLFNNLFKDWIFFNPTLAELNFPTRYSRSRRFLYSMTIYRLEISCVGSFPIHSRMSFQATKRRHCCNSFCSQMEDNKNNSNSEEKPACVEFIIDLTQIESIILPKKRKLEEIDVSANLQIFPFQAYSRAEVDLAINAAVVAAGPGGVLPPAILGLPAAMNAQFAAMNAQFAAINARFDALEDRLALVNNRSCTANDCLLQPRVGVVPGVALPVGFPATLKALRAMTSAAIAPFLAHYGLLAGGTVRQKQIRLALFLGVPSHAA